MTPWKWSNFMVTHQTNDCDELILFLLLLLFLLRSFVRISIHIDADTIQFMFSTCGLEVVWRFLRCFSHCDEFCAKRIFYTFHCKHGNINGVDGNNITTKIYNKPFNQSLPMNTIKYEFHVHTHMKHIETIAIASFFRQFAFCFSLNYRNKVNCIQSLIWSQVWISAWL